MVGIGVEATEAGGLGGAEERERRDRRTRAQRAVVAARPRDAAPDLLAGGRDGVDARVDRVADARVVDRALNLPAAADARVLRREEQRVVRLVPREPQRDGRQPDPARGDEEAAVARRRGL